MGNSITSDHGAVAIAAITSCTNTSNPQVMVAAGLLARNAARRGVTRRPWVKTTLSPGSKVVMDYLQKAGLIEPLEALGFHLAGFGCMTCIGASGPLIEEISAAVHDHDLTVVSVLSGNRNFEGRINPDVTMNYLCSPPLVVAYALAGSMDIDLITEPLAADRDGRPVYLADLWPTENDIDQVVADSVDPDMFHAAYTAIFDGDHRWQALRAPLGTTFAGPRIPPTSVDHRTSTTSVHSPVRLPTSTRPGCWSSSATPSPLITSPQPGRSRPTATPAATSPVLASAGATSTPSPRDAATMR